MDDSSTFGGCSTDTVFGDSFTAPGYSGMTGLDVSSTFRGCFICVKVDDSSKALDDSKEIEPDECS